MSRSAVDATRFTATSPHAYSKPSSLRPAASNTFLPSSSPTSHALPHTSNKLPLHSSPSEGSSLPTETAAQKVARLRAAHAAQKQAQISRWDRIVVRGRVVADAAHKFTTLGLIGLTVIAGGIAVFSLGDMIVYNRRKRKSFFAEQHMILQQRLAEARAAAAGGTADEDQMLLINRERAADEAEEAFKNREGVWKIVKGAFSTKGLKEEETESGLDVLGKQGLSKMGEGSTVIEPVSQEITQKDVSPKEGILQAVEEIQRQEKDKFQTMGSLGGSLDHSAEQATTKAKSGWANWFTSK